MVEKAILSQSLINNLNSIKVFVIEKSSNQTIEISNYLLTADSVRKMFKGIFYNVEVNYTPNVIKNTSNIKIDHFTYCGI